MTKGVDIPHKACYILPMKKILTGIPDFEALIQSGDKIYVDKTSYVYQMLGTGERFFFISRPRRFGKSLMCSTLDALFSGKKELFKDLYIGKTDYDFKSHLVLRFDFSRLNLRSHDTFLSDFQTQVFDNALRTGISIPCSQPSSMMDALLKKLDSPVVIIDEFDSPMIDAVAEGEQELAERMRRDFNAFYKVIKSYTGKIRFLFMTGCTKLSGLSIFSAMNNLNDISTDSRYAGMFGYTEEELVKYFSEHIDQKLSTPGSSYSSKEEFLDALRGYYDGYRFSPFKELRVYNPVSIGKYFSSEDILFSNYWVMTGGLSTLAVTLARNTDLLSIAEERLTLSIDRLSAFDAARVTAGGPSKTETSCLLYYAGYLTIKDSYKTNVILGFPDTEVRTTFISALVQAYSRERDDPQAIVTDAVCAAERGDHRAIIGLLNKYYRLFNYKDTEGRQEQWVKLLFKAFFGMLSLTVYTETPGGRGRIDAVMITETSNYVFEFKVDGKSADDAMEQIIDRHYDWFFTSSPKPLHLIGIDFSTEERQIVSYTHMLYGSGEVEEIAVL